MSFLSSTSQLCSLFFKSKFSCIFYLYPFIPYKIFNFVPILTDVTMTNIFLYCCPFFFYQNLNCVQICCNEYKFASCPFISFSFSILFNKLQILILTNIIAMQCNAMQCNAMQCNVSLFKFSTLYNYIVLYLYFSNS